MDAEQAVRERYLRLHEALDERARRLFVAAEAVAIGFGGIAMVSRATGVARRTIGMGMKELRALEAGPAPAGPQRIRKAGGGRKTAASKDPTLAADLERLVEPVTRGDPESPLRW